MAYYPFATEYGAHYRLIGPTGVVAQFNDPLDPNYVGMVTELSGLDSADVRESATDLVEADGGVHGAFYYARRPIVITARVFGHASVVARNTRLDLARRASDALRADSQLLWKPSTRQENLVVNPSPRVDTSGWTNNATAVPVSRSTAWNSAGTASFRVNGTTGAGTTSPGVVQTNRFAVRPNGRMGLRMAVNITTLPTGNAGVIGAIRFLDSTGTWLGIGTDIPVSSSGTGIQSLTAIGTVPANAVTGYVIAYTNSTAASAIDFSVDAVLAMPLLSGEVAVPAYFDGNTAGYYWQGVANNTQSGNFVEMFTTVRRQQPFRESGAWNKDVQISLVSQYAQLYSSTLKTQALSTAAENRGSAPFYPIFNLTGPATNPTITDGVRTLRTTGMSAGADLAAGETLQIDALNHWATFTAGARNGQLANRFIDWNNTTWPYLTPAALTTFTPSAGTGTVVWRDAWV